MNSSRDTPSKRMDPVKTNIERKGEWNGTDKKRINSEQIKTNLWLYLPVSSHGDVILNVFTVGYLSQEQIDEFNVVLSRKHPRTEAKRYSSFALDNKNWKTEGNKSRPFLPSGHQIDQPEDQQGRWSCKRDIDYIVQCIHEQSKYLGWNRSSWSHETALDQRALSYRIAQPMQRTWSRGRDVRIPVVTVSKERKRGNERVIRSYLIIHG